MITAQSLLAAIERKRTADEMTYADVASQIGVHPAMFTRMKKYEVLPSKPNVEALVEWLGEDYDANCSECEKAQILAEQEIDLMANGVKVGTVTTQLTTDDVVVFADDDDVEIIDEEDDGEESTEIERDTRVFQINGFGRLSESEDEETQKAVQRVKELLTEGAVGVSVALDLHPDDSAVLDAAFKAQEKDGWEKPLTEYLPSEDWQPRQRVRHTAIVDTPAYSDARLTLNDDGTVSGPITFEGIFTGDLRYSAGPEKIELDASRTPSPIIWDKYDGDHSGMTVGFIEEFSREEVTGDVAGRPVLDDEAITAAFKPMAFPASWFAQTMPTAPEPLRIGQPDAQGYRPIRGLAAPKGICHRSSMTCWTWPGNPDPFMKHFHTGTLIGLDNGKDIRVGALTIDGKHLDPALAKAGVQADHIGEYGDDARNVFALVRAWDTKYGLMIAGAIPPGVPESVVGRALACSPSVEFWPARGQRQLVGIHIVPRPALPVLSSMSNGVEIVTTDEVILLEEPTDDDLALDEESLEEETALTAEVEIFDFGGFYERMERMEEKLDAVLLLMPVEDVALPEE